MCTIDIAGFGAHGALAGLTALEELRLAGLQAVADFRFLTLKAHLRQADRLGCRFTLIIGDDEVIKGSVFCVIWRLKYNMTSVSPL